MGIYTQYSFVNRGTTPATDVRIKLTYPIGTQIKKITPPFKYKESEDGDSKVVELYVNRLEVDRQLSVSLHTEYAPTGPPEILCNEKVKVRGWGERRGIAITIRDRIERIFKGG